MRWFLVSAALVIMDTIMLVSFAPQAFSQITGVQPDEMHLKKLKALHGCVGCKLWGAKLSGAA